GDSYVLSFAFNPGVGVSGGIGADIGDTQVFWDGSLVLDLLNGDFGWTVYTLDVVASANSTELLFSGFQNPAINGLDAVSVTSAVPLPAALPLFASGLGVMGWLARRRRKQTPLSA